jgi:hypothetical protein
MVEFLRVQYRLGRVTETQLDMLVAQGKITEDDKEYIMSYYA